MKLNIHVLRHGKGTIMFYDETSHHVNILRTFDNDADVANFVLNLGPDCITFVFYDRKAELYFVEVETTDPRVKYIAEADYSREAREARRAEIEAHDNSVTEKGA